MDRSLKILHVEDNDADAEIMRELLPAAPSCSLQQVQRLDQARQRLADADFDLVLLDLSLPDSHGIETFDRLYAEYPDVPIVILTGHDDEEQAVREVGRGAQDYLVKGRFDDYALVRAAHYAVERHGLHRKLERQMRLTQASEARLRHIVESSADGIVIVNQHGIALFANPAAERLFGYPTDQLLDNLFGFPTAPGERIELDIEREDGSTAQVEIYQVEMEWEGELGYLTSLRDITQHKQTQARQQELERRLQWVHKMEAAGQVATQVGYNFSEILQEIAGQLEAVLAALPPDEQQRFARSQDTARRGLGIARALTRFSHQSLPPRRQALRIDQLVSDAAEVCRGHFGAGLQVVTEVKGAPLEMSGDYAALKQALLNLCYNARDALDKAGGDPRTLILGAHADATEAGSPCFRIDVTDNGTGMDEETCRRAFDPFFTTKTATQATTGLGLTTAFGIARQHQGWIECESEEGLGTTFSLILPAAPQNGDG